MTNPEKVCAVTGCSNPADHAFVCKTCGDNLVDVLTDISEWVLADLNLVETGQTRYVTPQPGRSGEEGVRFHDKAASIRRGLVTALTETAAQVARINGWEANYRTPSQAAKWLERRITTIRHHPDGGAMVAVITGWYDDALWVIDRPPPRSYLGNCTVTHFAPDDFLLIHPMPCNGRIYAKGKKSEARCDTCKWRYDADELREKLLAQLDDRIVTAAEFARLATYLGLPIDRTQVRKRINQWHHRGQVERRNSADDEAAPTFRFADLLALIYRDQEKRGDTLSVS